MSWNKIFHFSNSVISSWLSILAVPFLPRFQENNPGHIYTSLSLSLLFFNLLYYILAKKKRFFSPTPFLFFIFFTLFFIRFLILEPFDPYPLKLFACMIVYHMPFICLSRFFFFHHDFIFLLSFFFFFISTLSSF